MLPYKKPKKDRAKKTNKMCFIYDTKKKGKDFDI